MSNTILVGAERSYFVIMKNDFENAKEGDIVSVSHMDNQKFSGFSNKGFIVGNCPSENAIFPEQMCKMREQIGGIDLDELVAVFPSEHSNDCKIFAFSGKSEILSSEALKQKTAFMCRL